MWVETFTGLRMRQFEGLVRAVRAAVSRDVRAQVPPAARTAGAAMWTASWSVAEKRVVVG
ncbi:hypothetical protein QFZ75_007543 [Streptomyces sp. V3I8]|nr:hypothetical protein [Streptomyces sp. V3I8]